MPVMPFLLLLSPAKIALLFIIYPARALRALGLLLADGAPRVGWGIVWFPNPLAAGSGLGERRGQNALFFL